MEREGCQVEREGRSASSFACREGTWPLWLAYTRMASSVPIISSTSRPLSGEAELFTEGELADDVEGIVLEPGLVAVSAYDARLVEKTEISSLTPDQKTSQLSRVHQVAS